MLVALLFRVARVARGLDRGEDAEPHKRRLARRWSVIYDPTKRSFYALMPPLVGGTLLKAVFVGALQLRCRPPPQAVLFAADAGAQGYPVAQLVPLLLVELATLIVLIWKRPLSTLGKNPIQFALTSNRSRS